MNDNTHTNLGQLLMTKLDEKYNPQGFTIVPPNDPWRIKDASGHYYPMPKKHHVDVVRMLYISDAKNVCGKVAAVKFMQAEYGLGLKEAKDLCDWIAQWRGHEREDPFADCPK